MRHLWKIGLGIIGLWIIVSVIVGFAFAPSDTELIQQALDETVEAAAQGEASPVLDNLSRKFTYDSQMPFPGQISKVIRESKPQVTILNTEPVINGDTATVSSPVTVKLAIAGVPLDETIPDVTITLEKEWGLKYLFMPTAKWRIVDVTAPSLPSY